MSQVVGPYSPARRVGDWVITSGQLGLIKNDNGESVLVDNTVLGQLDQALKNLSQVLLSEGADLVSVVKATLFLVEMDDFASINQVWISHFDEPRPTRSAVGVRALPLGALVEVEAWAYAPI